MFNILPTQVSYFTSNNFLIHDDVTLAELSDAERICLLKDELEAMGAALNNCIQAVNELQQMVSYFMQQNVMKIDDVKDALIDHMGTFHSMLIVKNKEDSNESNIP